MVEPVRINAMVWYSREDYPSILKIMKDAAKLPRTWDEWHQMAETGLRHLSQTGIVVEKVNIDPLTFPDWCRARGLNVDAQARTAFANETAARKYGAIR